MESPRNLLGAETSPYLLQHRDNPVWWHPWGRAAFERAQREDKPVFLSIGYSTCYWCHVMERDSFERQEVADLLNRDFVSIKVDREELPDVDQIYMDVVVGIHGHGGWPLSVFLTPQRMPIWGGTFFYRDAFAKVLQGVADTWRSERAKVDRSGAELLRYLQSKQDRPGGVVPEAGAVWRGVEELLRRFDAQHGGFGAAPKFPPTQQLLLLMRAHALRGDAASGEAVEATLSAMARGGLCDQIGGGFHRYSVDAMWAIPHFEKMLYDNALLAQAYLEGAQLFGEPLYRYVAKRTLDYMLRDMRVEEGAFCCAEDAGDVGREGEFYVWQPHGVREVLGPAEGLRVCSLLSVTEGGNFEHGSSVPQVQRQERWKELVDPEIQAALEALRVARDRRVRPHRDTKVLAGWNGLAITALAKAFQLLGDERYRDGAERAASEILSRLRLPEGGLLRCLCGGRAAIPAMLEDYAWLIEGVLALFCATGEEQWLARAIEMQDEQDKRLWSAQHSAYLSSVSEGLIVPLCDWGDGATPAPNGISLSNLTLLAELSGEPRFAARAGELESGMPAEASLYPAQYCAALRALLLRRAPASVCVVAGNELDPTVLRRLWQAYLPFTAVVPAPSGQGAVPLFRGRVPRGEAATMYICRGQTCFEPMVDVMAALDVCSSGANPDGRLL